MTVHNETNHAAPADACQLNGVRVIDTAMKEGTTFLSCLFHSLFPQGSVLFHSDHYRMEYTPLIVQDLGRNIWFVELQEAYQILRKHSKASLISLQLFAKVTSWQFLVLLFEQIESLQCRSQESSFHAGSKRMMDVAGGCRNALASTLGIPKNEGVAA